MSVMTFLLFLVVAAICGAIGQALVGYSVGGCLVSALVGFVGALFGSWLAAQFSLPEPLPIRIGTETFPVVWSILGSALLVMVLSLINQQRSFTQEHLSEY
jgi:uncharacterized membrane protein YeaQ/YmgE (transglycosylase-associated protein family)